MILCNQFVFDAAHQLENYNGKCQDLHGHTYTLQICITGTIQENGLILDLSTLKSIVNQKVLQLTDHKYLNDVIKNPTVENVTVWIWDQLKDSLPLYEIRLWETPRISTIYSGK